MSLLLLYAALVGFTGGCSSGAALLVAVAAAPDPLPSPAGFTPQQGFWLSWGGNEP